MRKTFLKAGKPLAAAVLAAALLLFQAIPTASGEDIVYPGSSPGLRTPNSVFGSSAPSYPNGLFPNTPSGNNVTVKSGTIAGGVYGGIAVGVNSAIGNKVTITGGTIGASGTHRHVYGGWSESRDVLNNTVEITNAIVNGEIFGGWMASGLNTRANYNSVTIGSGANIRDSIYGAYSQGNGEVVGNSVLIDGGRVMMALGGAIEIIAGGYSNAGSGTVSGNSITINSGSIHSNSIAGGRGQNPSITGNTVTINGGTIEGVIYGGERINSVSTANGTVDNNSVSITGGTLTAPVYGGYSHQTHDTSVTWNAVSITGGNITGNIYGGYSNIGTAIYNTITLGGAPTITGSLHGGHVVSGGGDAFTGNLLQLMEFNSLSSSITSVQNFQYYRFCLPPHFDWGWLNAATVDLNPTEPSILKEVHIMTTGDIAKPQNGKITLIQAGSFNGTIRTIDNSPTMKVLQGTTLYFTGTLVQDPTELYLMNVSEAKVDPSANALPEASGTSAVHLLSQGADLAAGAGIAQALAATSEEEAVSEECLSRGYCLKSFTALSGGRLRYDTDSRAVTESFSLLSGLARGVDLPPGRLTLGAFLEYGAGVYNTDSTFHGEFGSVDIRGHGQAWHLGGGLLGRQNFAQTAARSHAYAEGSLRAGQMTNYYGYQHPGSHLNPGEIMGEPARVDFETSAPYYGAHLGLGYLWNISGATSLDTYGKYLWARQVGDSVTLPFGDPIKFSDVDSHRLQTGLRLSHALDEKFRPYAGAAYEYEFDSKAVATTHGLPIPSHSLRGDAWMGELGLSFSPEPGRPVTLDLGLQGYTGLKEGITGSIQLKVEF